MRRTSAFWAVLLPEERSFLVAFERSKPGNYGGGGYLPEDCSECGLCGQPFLGCGHCSACLRQYNQILENAGRALAARARRDLAELGLEEGDDA